MGIQLLLAIGLLGVGEARAAELLGGERVVIAQDVVINDDLYVAAQQFELHGTIDGDLILLAGEARLEGTVTGDVLLAAGQARVATDVAGSIRGAAGDLTVLSRVARDAVLAGGSVSLPQGAEVGRDLVLAAGEGDVVAPVGREVMAAGGAIRLDGEIGGSVLAQASTLELGDRARIGGNLTYTSETEAQLAPGAVVSGQVTHREPAWARQTWAERALLFVYGWLRALIGLLLAGLLLVAIFPTFTRRTETVLADRPLASLGAGLLASLGLPLISGLIFLAGLLVGGWWLGLVGLGTLALGLLGGTLVAGVAVGDWILGRFGRTGVKPGWALVPGLVALLLIGAIPYVGGLVLLVAALLGFGALALTGIRGRTGAVPI